jgi:tetratricopeptide (TPR) repeat protein
MAEVLFPFRAARAALVAGVALALGGCAAPPPAPVGLASNSPVASAAVDGPPEVNLSGALLYQIMAAEVALQRGDTGSAYATYMSVARQSRDFRLARRAAEIALGARALPQALEATRFWFQLVPQSGEAAQATAMLLVASGRYDEALEPLRAQLSLAADPGAELARVQQLLARSPDRAAGLRLFEQLAKPLLADPKTAADAHLALARAAQLAGDRERASGEVRAALAARPDDERVVTQAAQWLAAPEGKEEPAGRKQALTLLDGFLKRNPESVEARMTYGRLLIADTQLAPARTQFDEVIKRTPQSLDALYALGVLSMDRTQSRPDARSYFERYLQALESQPDHQRSPDPAYLNLARLAEEDKRYDDAMQWLDRVDDGPQFLNARIRKALLLGKMKRIDEGRRLLADTAPDSPEERSQIIVAGGQLLREAKRYRESFDFLTAALARVPDDPALLYDTAMAAEKVDRIDVMETHLRRLMKMRPDDAQAYNALGYTFADRNERLGEARDLIGHALKIAPDDAYILDSMGWVHFRLGDLPLARSHLERAFELRPEAEVAAHLGEVLWTMGDRERAREVWRVGIKQDDTNDTLRETLRRFKVKL